MKSQIEINQFIEGFEPELDDYFSRLCDKLKDLKKRLNALSIYSLLIAVVYYLHVRSNLKTIGFMGVDISDFSLIPKLLPLLFAFFLYEYSLLSIERLKVLQMLNVLYVSKFKKNTSGQKNPEIDTDYFFRLFIPFSFANESVKISDKRQSRFLRIWLSPIMLLFLPSLIFESLMLIKLFHYFWHDWLSTLSFLASAWLFITTIINYFLLFKNILKLVGKGDVPAMY